MLYQSDADNTDWYWSLGNGLLNLSNAGLISLRPVLEHWPKDQYWSVLTDIVWWLCRFTHGDIKISLARFILRPILYSKNVIGCTFVSFLIIISLQSLVYILITYYLVNLQFSVSDTLQNPIIADNFGLRIAELAYIFVGIMLFYFISNLFMWVTLKLPMLILFAFK